MTDRLHALLAARLEALPMAARCTPEVLLGRDAPGGLALPDHRSANRHCRLLAARDGWVALNLARPEDRELVPVLTAGAGG